MQVDIHQRIAEVPPDEWNRLNRDATPFLTHEFLHAAETSGSVSAATGWAPRHLALRDGSGRLVAAMPLYEKTHSWGEFVFDWAWARAYEQAGLDYYPKLVSAVPFTPATSRRLLCGDGEDEQSPALLLEHALRLARDSAQSSLHV
ncbi:MAG TPA: peptidogalycan biosysnthesis protein, partial [Woeseiaceae bacterium]|nr:peptidogalycan biosysnthesis protein [Woeseiaceae bacterium]